MRCQPTIRQIIHWDKGNKQWANAAHEIGCQFKRNVRQSHWVILILKEHDYGEQSKESAASSSCRVNTDSIRRSFLTCKYHKTLIAIINTGVP